MILGKGVLGDVEFDFKNLPATTRIKIENQLVLNRLQRSGKLEEWFKSIESKKIIVDCFDSLNHLHFPASRFYTDISPRELSTIISKTASEIVDEKTVLIIYRKDIFQPTTALEVVEKQLEANAHYGKEAPLKIIDITLDAENFDIYIFETSDNSLALSFDNMLLLLEETEESMVDICEKCNTDKGDYYCQEYCKRRYV